MGDEQRVSWQELLAQSRDDGRRFIVNADEELSAFVELERQVLTVTFYLLGKTPRSWGGHGLEPVRVTGKRRLR